MIREADGLNVFNRKDGQASRAELEKYEENLQQQIQFFGFLKQFFGPIFGQSIDGYLDHLKDKSDVTSIMLKNFSTFDTSGNDKAPFPLRDGRISVNEVRSVAGRDGNPHDVSWRDLLNFRPFPPILYAQNAEGNAGSSGSSNALRSSEPVNIRDVLNGDADGPPALLDVASGNTPEDGPRGLAEALGL